MIRRHSRQYEAVLALERWRQVRAEAIRRAGYRCIACGCGGSLDSVAQALGDFADLKFPSALGHSACVARLAGNGRELYRPKE